MKLVKSLGALAAGLLVALFAAEFIVANFGVVDTPPGLFQKSPTRAFEHRPYFIGRDRLRNSITINSQGLRDREYSLDKPPHVFRIFVLGDSVAFGDGVKIEDTFAKQMERLWVLKDKEVEVINGGVRGYNTHSELVMLKEVALGYHPDLIVVAYVLNDAEPSSKQEGLIRERNSLLYGIKEYVKDHFYLYSFFRRTVEIWRRRSAPANFMETYEDQFRPDHPGWKESYAALAEMRAVTAKKNIGLLLAVVPRLEGLNVEEKYPAQKIQDQVVAAGRELGIDTLDLLPSLRGFDEKMMRVSQNDTFHPNAAGHFLLAEGLKNYIDQKYLSEKK